MTDSYAIVETGGKQYRAEKGTTLLVDRLPDDEGAKVALRPVMFRGDGDVVLDSAGLEKVKVEATVAEHLRGEKIRIFKYKAKKGYRKRQGHRSELTKLEVVDVKLLSRKPAASKAATEAEPKAEAKPAARAEGSGSRSRRSRPPRRPRPQEACRQETCGQEARSQASRRPASPRRRRPKGGRLDGS